MAVIIIGAASLVIAKNIAFLGLSFLDIGSHERYGFKAELAAESCIEEALNKVNNNRGIYEEDFQLQLNGSSCSASIDRSPENWIIVSRGSASEYTKEISLTAEINNKIVINRWNE